VWKEGLDKTRLNTKAIFEDSKGAISSIQGSQALQNHFESFLNFGSNGKTPSVEKPPNTKNKDNILIENQDENAVEDPGIVNIKTKIIP